MTTAIFVFTNGCNACDYVKNFVYNDVKKLYESNGIRVIEYYAGIINNPPFVSKCTFFPMTILVPNDVANNAADLSAENFFNSATIMNTKVVNGMPGKPSSEYNLQDVADYGKFAGINKVASCRIIKIGGLNNY